MGEGRGVREYLEVQEVVCLYPFFPSSKKGSILYCFFPKSANTYKDKIEIGKKKHTFYPLFIIPHYYLQMVFIISRDTLLWMAPYYYRIAPCFAKLLPASRVKRFTEDGDLGRRRSTFTSHAGRMGRLWRARWCKEASRDCALESVVLNPQLLPLKVFSKI